MNKKIKPDDFLQVVWLFLVFVVVMVAEFGLKKLQFVDCSGQGFCSAYFYLWLLFIIIISIYFAIDAANNVIRKKSLRNILKAYAVGLYAGRVLYQLIRDYSNIPSSKVQTATLLHTIGFMVALSLSIVVYEKIKAKKN